VDTHLGAWEEPRCRACGRGFKVVYEKMKKLRFESSRRGTIKGDLGGGVLKKEAWEHEEWAKAGSELGVNLVEVATLLIKPNVAWLEGYLTLIHKPRELF
jgi:hypothetical protein